MSANPFRDFAREHWPTYAAIMRGDYEAAVAMFLGKTNMTKRTWKKPRLTVNPCLPDPSNWAMWCALDILYREKRRTHFMVRQPRRDIDARAVFLALYQAAEIQRRAGAAGVRGLALVF